MFRLGYNTNGLPHHRVHEALELLADLGYGGVALTPDVGQLDPFVPAPGELERVRRTAEARDLWLTVETGARYLLDPRRKHFPTLLEASREARERRVEFLERCVDLAAELGARVVSLWAGRAPGGVAGDARAAGDAHEALWDRLCTGVHRVLEYGERRGVAIAFEPEPGMFVERPEGYRELRRRLGATGAELGLCLDVGHLLCTGDLPVERVIREHAAELAVVHLDDIRDGEHVHRMFGEGELDLPGALGALVEAGFEGLAAVELSRDGHRGPQAAEEAMGHLRAALPRPLK